MASSEIHAIRAASQGQPQMRRIIEKASQTFKAGVPVQVDGSDGGVKEWDGSTLAAAIAGFSKEPGANLTTVGVPKTLTYGSVPNQASAVKIPRGAPLNDGRTGFETASPDNVFRGQINPSGQTLVDSDVGKAYGMTKDADGQWYVDKTKTGGNAVVRIVKRDTLDTSRGVHFVVLDSAAQVVA